MLRRVGFCLGVALCCFSSLLRADATLLRTPEAKAFVRELVKEYHFKPEEVKQALADAEYQPQIIASMEKPYEKKSWDAYQSLFLTPQRLQEGLQFWQRNRAALEQAEKKYGVPASVIVAIIGVETLYGKHQGTYRVLDALSTLAFYYPKRSAFFTKELKEYFLLCREHHVPLSAYKGSYAGAMGKPQFMPSSYRFYAVDFIGKGHANLMEDDQDAISSVANYFHQHGWKNGQLVAQPVDLQGNKYKSFVTNARNPEYPYWRLVNAGVIPKNKSPHHPDQAGLIELTTQNGAEYWMAYRNFYVITRYNTSPQYALVVHILSDQLQNQWSALHRSVKHV
jgi:membrane-bound lytic murein transglycosylase B